MDGHATKNGHGHDTETKVQDAMEHGENIRDAVRDITLEALSAGALGAQQIREVVRAVFRGAARGVQRKDTRTEQALREVMAGMDDALAKAVEASRLAIEEAAGQVQKFGAKELWRGLEDLAILENLFLNTVTNTAQAARSAAGDILSDLVRHACITGTSTGAATRAAVKKLTKSLGKDLRDYADSSAEAAQEAGNAIAMAAAGILEGIAKAMRKGGGPDAGR